MSLLFIVPIFITLSKGWIADVQSSEQKGSNAAMMSKLQIKWGWHDACIMELWRGTKNLVLQKRGN